MPGADEAETSLEWFDASSIWQLGRCKWIRRESTPQVPSAMKSDPGSDKQECSKKAMS
jgi:hypothetical protein